MAGGLGKRLGERTQSTPKPLLPIEKLILEHILHDLEVSGVQEIYISVHYLADQIETFVSGRENIAEIEFLHEDEMFGQRRLGSSPRDLRTRSCRQWRSHHPVDFSALNDFHRRHNYDATIAVAYTKSKFLRRRSARRQWHVQAL